MELLGKIKIIVWNISLNYLPTLANMKYKKLVNTTCCPRCESEEEIVDHLFRYLMHVLSLSDGFFGTPYGLSSETGTQGSMRRVTSASTIKIKFDGAFDGQRVQLASSVVARNAKGEVKREWTERRNWNKEGDAVVLGRLLRIELIGQWNSD
ncbi:hypothetical protein Golob_004363, partial [Gossypium lobatum]|nr:hypothetical protein [Gossypium lobatum]